MSPPLENLELRIDVQDLRTIRAETPGHGIVMGKMELPRLHEDLVQVFQRWLAQDKLSDASELRALGSLLFGILFNGDIKTCFDEIRRKASKQQRLRIQLSFQEAAFKIAGYPWEFLYAPATETSRGYFLGTEQNIVLSRYMALSEDAASNLQAGEPLRLLVIVSGPKDLGPVLAPAVIGAIEKLASEQNLQVLVEEKPTIERFLERLEQNRPHLLHFLGHAQFDMATSQGSIALLDDDETSARWVPDYLFAEYFSQMESCPRLVFLHSCEGGANQFSANFSGLAPQLIRNNIPAVIAMQYPVENGAAILFSKTFYKELGRGAPVDSAVQLGRYALTTEPAYQYNNRVVGTPMLWMRSRSGVILPTTV